MPHLALIVLLSLGLAVPALADVYRWTDEDGRVHYGDQPPPGIDGEQVDLDVQPAGAGPPDFDTVRERLDERHRQRREQRDQARREREAERTREEQCVAARDRLQQFEATPPMRTTTTEDDGTIRLLTLGERNERLEDLRERVASLCHPGAAD